LNSRWVDLDHDQETARIAARRECAFALIDHAVARYNPVSEWPQFRETLWDGRSLLMAPPAPR
jgi:hypothetical protein